ncbi:epimerase [Skermanella stibiiresistens SB22]|uniref:Epimerase n=1 Tax=Skermanella stibiiresistens SB22 TaxID=1385369 RepID=W9GZE1_9PROT|nr:NAD-dependent epimerase/dehydratase family protein [Skermanella stibiiresistens]EWY36853.1 epimerase [Skermanella stibiiresistens SB22]
MALWLVTGGCGFIGSHLVDSLLARGDSVRVLDDLSTGRRSNLPQGVELLVGDVADAAVVSRAMAGVDGCFHLAAVASVQRGNEDWLGTHRVNLTGTVAVLDAARTKGRNGAVPVVYASSAAVYGDNPEMPLPETAATAPLSAYGADKLGCELHARVAWKVHGVPSTGFRFFNVYGPRQDPKSPYSGVIAIFADKVAERRGITVNGDGGQTRDFVYVTDVVRHLVAAMDSGHQGSRVFNVCTGRPTTVLELARIISRLGGVEPRIEHGPARAGDIRESLGDPRRAAEAFGFTAETPVTEGLRETLAAISGSLAAE